MTAIENVTKSPRARALAGLVLAGGIVGYAGVAGLADTARGAADVTITAVGDGQGGQWDAGVAAPVAIATGETVTWSFAGAGHNVGSYNTSDKDPRWTPYVYPGPGEFDTAQVGTTSSFTFYKSGTYEFICFLHPNMRGTVEVTGTDQEIPTGTPTPTPTPTVTTEPTVVPTASPTPVPTAPPVVDQGTTPPPTPAADTTKPALSSVRVSGKKRKATVRFTLSENATVNVSLRKRGARKVLRSASVQARAGTRSVVLQSSKIVKGRYTVTLTARDAMGNVSDPASAALRIRK